MKKNKYGNIEDLIVRVRTVTPAGTIDRNFLVSYCNKVMFNMLCIAGTKKFTRSWSSTLYIRIRRCSLSLRVQFSKCTPIGTLGVITEVTLRIRPLPEVRRYGSIVFPSFELGVAYMREVARQRCAPASIRLMDNMQFQIGELQPSPSLPHSLFLN